MKNIRQLQQVCSDIRLESINNLKVMRGLFRAALRNPDLSQEDRKKIEQDIRNLNHIASNLCDLHVYTAKKS